MNLSGIGRFLRNHAPGILMGMGTVGSVTAVVFAAKAVQPAADALESEERKAAMPEEFSFWQKIRVCGKYYIPAVGMEAFALMCFWAAHGIDIRRQAVVAGLYSTAEATLAEYQKKVVETIGEKENDRIKASIAEDHAADRPALSPVPAASADIWCVIDGRSFPSTYNKVKQVQNEFNHDMMSSMYKSRAELYWMLDPAGEYLRPRGDDYDVGWSVDKLLVLRVPNPTGPVLEIFYEDKDGLPYLPKPGFSSSML